MSVKNNYPKTTRSFLPVVRFVTSLNAWIVSTFKVDQPKSFRKYILLSKNKQKNPQFYGHLVRSNILLKFLKICDYGDVFLTNRTCLNHEFFNIKKYRQTSFRSENLHYEEPLVVELRVIEFPMLILK